MLDIGFVGWRGMVGSVLLERMREEGDFAGIAPAFYSTSAPGGPGPDGLGFDTGRLGDAFDVGALARHDVVVTCQGGDYTHEMHPRLRAAGWNGYWIDAASALRMEPETVLVLDPVNADVIADGLARRRRDYCGANCTVSILLMAFAGLFRAGLVEWVTSMTYQAASGAGAAHMRELASQMVAIGDAAREPLGDPASSALAVDRSVRAALVDDGFPRSRFGAPGRLDALSRARGHRQAPRGPAGRRDRGAHRRRARMGAGRREHPGGNPCGAHPGRGQRAPDSRRACCRGSTGRSAGVGAARS